MGIKRSKTKRLELDVRDYAIIITGDLFSNWHWGKTGNWNIILKQVKIAQHACQMIDISLYPSKLFFAAIDLLEAHLLVLDDLFFYITGLRIMEIKSANDTFIQRLSFWNMDSYKVLEQICDGLDQIRNLFVENLREVPIWNGSLEDENPMFPSNRPYSYACSHYEETEIDKKAVRTQLENIYKRADHYSFLIGCIYHVNFPFPKLLAMFRQSEKARTDYIEPWRHDFRGTRDSLIAKMEKDPKLGPWVNRYDHLSKNRDVISQLFYSNKEFNKEEYYNTGNWLSILTVAAVLQEYDEQHGVSSPAAAASDKDDDEDLLLRLSLYFKDEATAMRFLSSARQMNDKEIIALVKSYQRNRLCLDASINLWRVLHDANLFKTKYNNWNAQLNKP